MRFLLPLPLAESQNIFPWQLHRLIKTKKKKIKNWSKQGWPLIFGHNWKKIVAWSPHSWLSLAKAWLCRLCVIKFWCLLSAFKKKPNMTVTSQYRIILIVLVYGSRALRCHMTVWSFILKQGSYKVFNIVKD